VSASILGECFSEFSVSAQRLELLPVYSVSEEAEQIRTWRAGYARPERSVRNDSYLRTVAADVLDGRERSRIRVVDLPLSDYVRWEFEGYTENAAAGEEIRIAVRGGGTAEAQKALAGLPWDFWVFDFGTEEERVVLLEFDRDGEFVAEHLATQVDLRLCHRAWQTAWKHSVPLNEYRARRKASSAA
jgi:hypothetical protein